MIISPDQDADARPGMEAQTTAYLLPFFHLSTRPDIQSDLVNSKS